MKEKLKKLSFKDLTIDIEKISKKEIKDLTDIVIFDTNFLFITFEFKVDVIAELSRLVKSNPELFIYEGTLSELQAIEDKGDKNKKYLPLIAKMLKLYNFKIIESNDKYVDRAIIENLSDNQIIATNDKRLKFKVKENHIRLIQMRQKRYLEFD